MWDITTWLLFVGCYCGVVTASYDTNLGTYITNGSIVGKYVHVGNRTIRAWLGIPYAKPPMGELRFQKPQPPHNWYLWKWKDGQPKVCHQTDDSGYAVLKKTFPRWNPAGEMSEDCLYVNVYAPEKNKTNLSTIVWIHGGGFYKGSISLDLYNPKYLVAKQDVIVVQIQYRLGSFGLLYMGEDKIPGNMGLQDQAMAIQWVHDNIEYFGGNKSKITLMGESAGSASVGYHMISNKTRHLFQRAILMSGSPLNYWAYTKPKEALNRSLLFASYAGCKRDSFEERRKCLLALTPKELLAADKSVLSMTPTVDGDFIMKSPFEAVQSKDHAKIPVLAGLVRNEGMPGIIYFLQSVITVDYNNFTKSDFDVFLRMMSYFLGANLTKIQALGNYYESRYEEDYGEAADMMFGDFFISCAALDYFNNVTNNSSSSYLYYFNHRSKLDQDPPYTDVMHGGELQYLFGRPFAVPGEYDDADRNISDMMMTLWANFSKTGTPGSIETWKPYMSPKGNYFKIQTTNESQYVRTRYEYCLEWPNYVSYYKTISATDMCQFLKNAVWEATIWLTYHIGWLFTYLTKCYNW